MLSIYRVDLSDIAALYSAIALTADCSASSVFPRRSARIPSRRGGCVGGKAKWRRLGVAPCRTKRNFFAIIVLVGNLRLDQIRRHGLYLKMT